MRLLPLFFLLVLPPLADPLNPGLPPSPLPLNRASPSAAVEGFLSAARQRHFADAAHYLDLSDLSPEEQAAEGPQLARRLRFVLDRQPKAARSPLSRRVQGERGRGGEIVLSTVALPNQQVPIQLAAVATPGGTVWVFSLNTVSWIDRLYEATAPPFSERLPELFFVRPLGELELWQWLGILVVLVAATVMAYLLERLLLAVGARIARMTPLKWDDQLVVAARGPLRLPFWSFLVTEGTLALLLPPQVQQGFQVVCRSLVVIGFAWFFIRFAELLRTLAEAAITEKRRGGTDVASLRTQLAVLQRVVTVVVYIVAIALLLIQFPGVRSVGVSLLASAGFAGLVVGIAAQKPLGAVLSGIQLSVTQPIRIGDSVVMEGESGTIEEVSLTYVVVRIWDLRRLIVPISYFLDKPFQNWSKGPSQLLGTVLLQVDYTADVEAFRGELERLLQAEGKPLWDGKTAQVSVTDASERTQTLRVLVSARDAGASWELRCLLREKLILFLRQHPAWLPVQRTLSV